ncbi:hypothetical protein QNO07_19210 [Streptomyces sp. 549]|uniref:hypothetical protein n=1 Tax=Streptomyces sp. 549 TaxID=3049076 RepID=UPI0024C29EA6|nr:hypothetical protein [Streptomyces sp. 549]MDK1475519.1 hypothetical protein [Streptomyces sp. 549]
MKKFGRVGLVAATTLVSTGLLFTQTASAVVKDTKCTLHNAGWIYCVYYQPASVPAQGKISVKLVSSGGKKVSLRLTDTSGNALATKKQVSPGGGYTLIWKNPNVNKSKPVRIQAKRHAVVDVKANLRYKY